MSTQVQTQTRAAAQPSFVAVPIGLLQRKCACGQHTIAGDECSECRQKREGMMQRAAVSAASVDSVPPIVHDVLSSPGQPLDAGTRAFMEPRFGHDFSQVRVHTDGRAAESAQAVNALAYTVGRDVVFGPGQYGPGTSKGRRLLAHELTHTIQQSQSSMGNLIQIGSPRDSYEQEADKSACVVGEGSSIQDKFVPFGIAQKSPLSLQRLIRTTNVHCSPAAAGVAHTNPFSADRRASDLIGTALTKIGAARAMRAVNPADPDVVAVGNALHTAFLLDPANDDTWTLGPPNVRLPVIQRRLEAAKSYIDSVVFTINCFPVGGPGAMACGTCDPGDEAFTCAGNVTDIALCPPFWASSLNQRGRILAHEVFHITFGFIEDWGNPDVHNAHCYAQFVALLNGFNSPAGFRCH